MLKNLNSEQKNILASIRQGMDFAADIAHACITVYLASDDKRFLRVYHQSMPKTQFLQQPELAPGREVRISEEPLIARCLQRNVPLEGKRELSIGQFAGVRVYPVQDRRGKCFAAVVFDFSGVDDIFINVAFEFLKTPARPEQDSEFYRRLAPGDALMVVDAEKKIIAANSTARHIFQVVGITTPIGLRTNSVQINWPLVGMVLKTGTAEGKEIRLRGMLLAMRVVPVGGTAEASYAIVILRDITELKKRDEELLVKAAVIKEKQPANHCQPSAPANAPRQSGRNQKRAARLHQPRKQHCRCARIFGAAGQRHGGYGSGGAGNLQSGAQRHGRAGTAPYNRIQRR